jgi:hypothetical protein
LRKSKKFFVSWIDKEFLYFSLINEQGTRAETGAVRNGFTEKAPYAILVPERVSKNPVLKPARVIKAL